MRETERDRRKNGQARAPERERRESRRRVLEKPDEPAQFRGRGRPQNSPGKRVPETPRTQRVQAAEPRGRRRQRQGAAVGHPASVRGVRDGTRERHEPQAAREPADDRQGGRRSGRETAEHGCRAEGQGRADLSRGQAEELLPRGGDRRARAVFAGRFQAAAAAESVEEGEAVRAAEAGRVGGARAQLETQRDYLKKGESYLASGGFRAGCFCGRELRLSETNV